VTRLDQIREFSTRQPDDNKTNILLISLVGVSILVALGIGFLHALSEMQL
jgi:hypothetical protein